MTQQHSYENLTALEENPQTCIRWPLDTKAAVWLSYNTSVMSLCPTYIINLTLFYHDPQHSCTYIMAPQRQRLTAPWYKMHTVSIPWPHQWPHPFHNPTTPIPPPHHAPVETPSHPYYDPIKPITQHTWPHPCHDLTTLIEVHQAIPNPL